MVEVRELSGNFVQQVESAARTLAAAVRHAGDCGAVEEADRCAARLDPGVAAECVPVGDGGVLVLRGLPVAQAPVGPTPPSWSESPRDATALWDATLLLLASVLGRAIGWEGQQDGRLVHDIVPTKGHEEEQTGASSSVTLSAYTEDAFHPGRANLVLLACLRNRDAVPTRVASVRHARLSAVERAVLERPTLPILPDDSYTDADAPAAAPAAPEVATLWEGDSGLGIRYDPAYTPLEQASPDYGAAYDWLTTELDRVAVDATLGTGEILVIDNDVAVHGRQPFRARYDGTDRWLKRVSVRTPDSGRPAAEAAEHGYGQRIIDPLASS